MLFRSIQSSVQAAVRVITYQRKLVATTDLGISCDDNLSVALRRHALAVGAAISSDGWIAEGRETGAGMNDAESDGTFHFLKLEGLIRNQKLSARNFYVTPMLRFPDERRSRASVSLAVMAANASPPRTLSLHKPGAVLRARR